MKTILTPILALIFAFSSLSLVAGDKPKDKSSKEIEETQVVDAGTYEVTAYRVDPKEKEIYVKTDDNKTIELYFTGDTALTRDGQDVEFTELKKGQKLEVKLAKEGEHNKPLEVRIMEDAPAE